MRMQSEVSWYSFQKVGRGRIWMPGSARRERYHCWSMDILHHWTELFDRVDERKLSPLGGRCAACAVSEQDSYI
jgi:hypothetical protein